MSNINWFAKTKREFCTQHFIKFTLIGGFAALVNFSSRIILNYYMSYSNSIITAYLFGMITAFSLNKLFLFKKATTKTTIQVIWFSIINILAVLQTLFVSLLFAKLLLPTMGFHFHIKETAHAIGIAIPIFTSYLGHKYFTFK